MKTLASTIAAWGLLLGSLAAAQDGATIGISAEPIVQGGQSTVTVVLSGGTEAYGAANATLQIPNGFVLLDAVPAESLTSDFSVDVHQAGNTLGAVVYSSTGLGSFTGDADLILLTLEAPLDAAVGENAVSFAAGGSGLSNADGSASIAHNIADGSIAVMDASDTDGDGLLDDWETDHFLTLDQDAGGDADSDGLVNGDELNLGTDPNDVDSDLDGATDGAEVAAGTDPLDASDVPVGEGEGEGEGPEPNLCDSLDDINSQFDAFRNDFGITGTDFDGDGIDDDYTLALLDVVCSRDSADELRTATLTAFEINRMNLEAETDFDSLQDYNLGLAALLLLSTEMRTAVTDALADQGITLSETYEVVTGIGGVFMPSAMKGIDLAEGYETFVPPTKAIDEPYSATGDLDEDDVTNLEEYQNIQLLSGTPEDFANSANDPTNDGTMLPGGEGEGEGPSPICGALWIDGVPFSGGVGDLALLTLVVGALLLAQGRRRSRVQK